MPVDVVIALIIAGFSTVAFVTFVKLKGGLKKMLEDLEASNTHNAEHTHKHS